MPRTGDLGSSSLAMAAGVGLITLFLGLRLWYERKGRLSTNSEGEREFFRFQDFRRGLGIGIMSAIALATAYGGQISHRVDGKANLAFVVVWFSVIVLVVVLLVLAMIDWVATFRFARRARRRMLRERVHLLRETLSKSVKPSTGDDPPNPTAT